MKGNAEYIVGRETAFFISRRPQGEIFRLNKDRDAEGEPRGKTIMINDAERNYFLILFDLKE